MTIFNSEATSGIGGASDPELVSRRREGRLLRRQRKREPRHLCREPQWFRPQTADDGRRVRTRSQRGPRKDRSSSFAARRVRGPTTELYSARPDGTGETRLTDNGVVDDAPAVLPGRQPRSLWETAGGISKMNIDGSGVTFGLLRQRFQPGPGPRQAPGSLSTPTCSRSRRRTSTWSMPMAPASIMVTDTRRPRSVRVRARSRSGNEEQMVVRSGRPGPGSRADWHLVDGPLGGQHSGSSRSRSAR